MRVLLPNGEPDPRLDDPRLSTAQKDAAVAIAAKDARARVVGLDSKMRPVVSARLGTGRLTRTALMRNGAPAKPVPPMTESWQDGRGD